MTTCPRCRQSGLHQVVIPRVDEKVRCLCQECETLWDEPEITDVCRFTDFQDFMESHGLEPWWHEVEITGLPGERPFGQVDGF